MLPSAWVARWRIARVTTGSVLRTWIGLVGGPWIETGLRHGPSGWRAVESGLAAALGKARRTVPWRDGCLRNVCLRNVSLRNVSLRDGRNIGLSGRERVVERRLGTSLLPLRQALLRGARWLGMLGLLYSRRSSCRRVGRRLSWRISRARLSVCTSLGVCWVARRLGGWLALLRRVVRSLGIGAVLLWRLRRRCLWVATLLIRRRCVIRVLGRGRLGRIRLTVGGGRWRPVRLALRRLGMLRCRVRIVLARMAQVTLLRHPVCRMTVLRVRRALGILSLMRLAGMPAPTVVSALRRRASRPV